MRKCLHSIALAACAMLLTVSAAWAIDPGEMFDDPAKEERAREIGRSLRCMVCQNQSIFDSNASLAKDLRVLVRERIDAGDSDREVVDFVAERYGDYVLLKPPVDTHTYVLWIAPALFVLSGAALVFVYHRNRRVPAEGTSLSAGDREAARQILKGERS